MKKIAVLFSGKGTNFAYITKHLHNKKLKIAVALTNNPNADGITIAKENNIPLEIVNSKTYANREDFDAVVVDRLKYYSVDLTVLAGFMRILTPIFTDSIKSINLHPSLLPRHKGLHAIERSYEDDFSLGGVTVHYVTSKLDDGEIIEQESIKKDNLSLEEYSSKVFTLEKEVLTKAILKVLK